jgi:hypothetical protein
MRIAVIYSVRFGALAGGLMAWQPTEATAGSIEQVLFLQ